MLVAVVSAMVFICCTETRTERVAVIPQPLKVEARGEARFVIDADTRAVVLNAEAADRERMEAFMANTLNIPAATDGSVGKNVVILCIEDTDSDSEAYKLNISREKIEITAPSAAGVFYGLQTLVQLNDNGEFAACRIEDEPRFAYRGVMLDVSRHWFGKEHVKKQIDILSRYKFNRLHLHLTDAAGWRIEIDKYPRLTEFDAWRPDSLWKSWWFGVRKYV